MKKILIVIFILFVTACDGQDDHAFLQQQNEQKEPSGRVLQYGIYTLLSGGEVVDDPKTTTGKGVSKPVITRDRTVERIPLVRDKYMAYQYRLSNLPHSGKVKLRRVLKHPEFKLPDGSVTTGSDFTVIKKLERGEVFAYDAYALNEDYEMVEGEWVFQIWYKGEKLVEQQFTTYKPDEEELAKLTAPSWLDKKAVASGQSF